VLKLKPSFPTNLKALKLFSSDVLFENKIYFRPLLVAIFIYMALLSFLFWINKLLLSIPISKSEDVPSVWSKFVSATPVGGVADPNVAVDDVPGVGATTVIGDFPDCISLSCSLICIL